MLENIPPSYYQFSQYPEYKKLRRRFEAVNGLNTPFLREGRSVTPFIDIGDQRLINFSSFDYLGLAHHDAVITAAQKAALHYGTSSSASRLSGGELPIHRCLEQEISEFIGTEDCCAFVSGHATNETTIGSLLSRRDLVLYDKLSHNSIVQGCKLSGAKRIPFEHNRWEVAEAILKNIRADYRRAMIVIEGVYSMDGDIPNVPEFVEVCRRHKTHLMVDEAHSIGTLGKTGRGVLEHWDLEASDVDILMGTLSKSFGSCGGYIAGCEELIHTLKYNVPSFVFSVGMPPPAAGAALAAIRHLKYHPSLVEQLQANSERFGLMLKCGGVNINAENSPIVPLVTGCTYSAIELSQQLFGRGINVQPIVFPAVPNKSSRLRFFVTSEHTKQQIDSTAETVSELKGTNHAIHDCHMS